MTTNKQIAYAHEIADQLSRVIPYSCDIVVEDWNDMALFRLSLCFPFTHVAVQGNESYHFCDNIDIEKILQSILKFISTKKVYDDALVVLPIGIPQSINEIPVSPQGYSSPSILLDFTVIPM